MSRIGRKSVEVEGIWAEKISPVGESPCLCPTSLIPFSISFASWVSQSSGGCYREVNWFVTFLLMMIMGQHPSNQKMLNITTRASKETIFIPWLHNFLFGKKRYVVQYQVPLHVNECCSRARGFKVRVECPKTNQVPPVSCWNKINKWWYCRVD